MNQYKKNTPGWFKTKISLADFIMAYTGGKVELSADSTKTSPKLHLLDDDGHRVDTIIINQNKYGYETYFIQGVDGSGGKTIFDFVMEYNKAYWGKKMDFRDTLKELIKFTSQKDWDKIRTFTPAIKSDSAKAQYINKKYLKPLHDRTYFHSRGISDETLDADIFKGVLFNHRFRKDIDGVETYHNNIAYQMFRFPTKDDPSELVCISSKNREIKDANLNVLAGINIKHFQGTRSLGVVASKPASRNLDKLFVMESFDDALCHYELEKDNLDPTKIAYVSTEGQITLEQIEVIQKLLELNHVKELAFGFDNDRDGDYYRSVVSSRLLKNPLSVHIVKPMKNNPHSRFEIQISDKTIEGAEIKSRKIIEHFNKLNFEHAMNATEDQMFELDTKLLQIEGHPPTIEHTITFANTSENWMDLSLFMMEYVSKHQELNKASGLTLSDERPYMKDWADVLETRLTARRLKGLER